MVCLWLDVRPAAACVCNSYKAFLLGGITKGSQREKEGEYPTALFSGPCLIPLSSWHCVCTGKPDCGCVEWIGACLCSLLFTTAAFEPLHPARKGRWVYWSSALNFVVFVLQTLSQIFAPYFTLSPCMVWFRMYCSQESCTKCSYLLPCFAYRPS